MDVLLYPVPSAAQVDFLHLQVGSASPVDNTLGEEWRHDLWPVDATVEDGHDAGP